MTAAGLLSLIAHGKARAWDPSLPLRMTTLGLHSLIFHCWPLDGNGRRKRGGSKLKKAGGVGVRVEPTQLPFGVIPAEQNTLKFGPSAAACWFIRSGLV